MYGSMAHTGHRSSNLREKELPEGGQSSNDPAELEQLPDNPEPDVEGSAASTGRKRRGPQPTLTPEEKRRKIATDKNYRRGKADKHNRRMEIASECGGIHQMEFVFPRLEQIKSKHGQLEEIEFKLNKLEQMEAEQAVLSRGIEEIESILVEDQYSHGANSVNSNNQLHFMEDLRMTFGATSTFSGFNGLNGERQEVNANMDAYGDVTDNGLLRPSAGAERCNQGCF